MNDQNQNNDDFSGGFLIKDKSGQLKKVQDDKVVDFQSPTPSSPPKAATAFVKKEDKVGVAPLPLKPKERVAVPEQAEKSYPAAWPLSPPAPISPSAKAAYIIEPEDEEEIKKHQGELKKMAATPLPDLSTAISIVIDNVIRQHNLRFDDEIKKKRFFTVIESRLKNIRDSIETEEVLTRASKVGGLELVPEIAKNIISTVEEEASKLPELKLKEEPLLEEKKFTSALKDITPKTERGLWESDSILAPAPPAFIPRPKVSVEEENKEIISPQLKKVITEEEPLKPEEKTGVEEKKPALPAEPAVEPVPPKEPGVISFARPVPAVAQPVEEAYQRSPEDEMAKMARVRKPELQRPQMVDIRQPLTAVGPVEELADIDLKELRRLGASPREAAEKILEKVYLLEEESWKMRMDGIKAWQSSPVHHLYLETGRQSIESGKTVEESIQMLANENKPHLLIEEFFAINDLNSKLIA